jgi:hypothetical protein
MKYTMKLELSSINIFDRLDIDTRIENTIMEILHATICRGPKVYVRNMLDDFATTSHASVASQDSYSIIEL